MKLIHAFHKPPSKLGYEAKRSYFTPPIPELVLDAVLNDANPKAKP